MFTVYYKDDYNRTHLTVVSSLADLRFLMERFEVLRYEPV